jgi:hypothetical protein
MRKKRATDRLLKNERTREWVFDFFVGMVLFVSVAFFAGVHKAPALPAPLAKTEAMIAKNTADTRSTPHKQKSFQMAQAQGATTNAEKAAPAPQTDNRGLLIAMTLVFSILCAVTLHFWRLLRREYASPRRKRGRG